MELLALGARFYERLGYVLALLSVSILCAGVIWSLRVHVGEKYRTLFLVATLAALFIICGGVLLLLVLAQPPAPATLDLQPAQPIDQTSDRVESIDHAQMIEVYVQPDGTVVYQSQATTVKHLVHHLRREHPHKRLHVTLRVDAETKLGVVTTVITELRKQDVEQFRFHKGE